MLVASRIIYPKKLNETFILYVISVSLSIDLFKIRYNITTIVYHKDQCVTVK